MGLPARYTVDVNFDKKQVNKESFKDGAMRRRARGQVKQTLEERCVEPERCEGEGGAGACGGTVVVGSLFAACVAGVPPDPVGSYSGSGDGAQLEQLQ